MRPFILFGLLLFCASCSTTNYYIVRHAEKAPSDGAMTSDVPLSEAGQQRALALGGALHNKKIRAIYTTPYKRTQGTAQPLSSTIGVPLQTYDPRDTSFVRKLKAMKGNVLIVGHSNTVDDLVNGLTGINQLKDLPETQYGNLFIVKKKGSKYTFEQKRFGQ
jgi:2,3-bisphosphoglycerate-dependent phosphoglycerate mutase